MDLFTDPSSWYDAHQLLIGQAGVNVLLALSVWLTLYAGQLALASIGFMAIGAYTSVLASIHWHLPLVVGALLGALFAALCGLLIGLPVLRLRGIFLAIATIGFGEVVRYGFILNIPITGEGQGLNNPDADPGALWPVWLTVVIAVVGFRYLLRTRAGLAMAAIREDEIAAASSGIDVSRYQLSAFVAGAALAGLAGALDAHLNFFVDPTEYTFSRAVLVLVFVVVGGVATVYGPVAGAIVLTALPEIFRSVGSFRDVAYGAILLIVVLFAPKGLIAPNAWRLPRLRRKTSA